MDYSAANLDLWNGLGQFGLISGAILIAYLMYQRLSFFRKTMMPIAVAGGFMLLAARYLGLRLDDSLLEAIVYHALALGFIASAFRVTVKDKKGGGATGIKSGAMIVSTYLLQGIVGLVITLGLSYTLMPGLFRAAGILLPMGFGQGPGQANNVGTMLESAGFQGGRSFGLSIAAMGYLVACSVGVVMLNVLRRKKAIQAPPAAVQPAAGQEGLSGAMPVSLDALSLQAAGVSVIYLATYWVTRGLTSGILAVAPGASGTVTPLIWGFNFIIGSALAMLFRGMMNKFGRPATPEVIRHKNEILNRISGVCFDYMVVAGIASIRLEDIRGLWAPFLIMTAVGGVVTWLYLSMVCKRVYPDYYSQGLIAMFGMLTGTISSGVLLLREIDPDLSTPAANQLLVGSGFAIILGAPMLVLISVAARSDTLTWISLSIMVVYFAAMVAVILAKGKKKAKA